MKFYKIFINYQFSLITTILLMAFTASFVTNDYVGSIIYFILLLPSLIFDVIYYIKNNS